MFQTKRNTVIIRRSSSFKKKYFAGSAVNSIVLSCTDFNFYQNIYGQHQRTSRISIDFEQFHNIRFTYVVFRNGITC